MNIGVKLPRRMVAGVAICLVIATVIAWFEGLGLGFAEFMKALGDGSTRGSRPQELLNYLLSTYSFSTNGVFLPVFAWASGGFVSGLVSKDPDRGLAIGILSVGIVWFVFALAFGGVAEPLIKGDSTSLIGLLGEMKMDLFVTGLAATLPASLGGFITKDRGFSMESPEDLMRNQ